MWDETDGVAAFVDKIEICGEKILTQRGFPKKDARFQHWTIFLVYSAKIGKVK